MTGRSATGTLRFAAAPGDARPGETTIVLDTTWTRPDGTDPSIVSVRDIAASWLAEHDLIAETSDRLDAWAAGSGVIERMTIGETSFWFYVRLRHWLWLEERVLWAAIVSDVVERHRPSRIAVDRGADEALVDCLRLVAEGDGPELDVAAPPEPEPDPVRPPPPSPAVAARPSLAVRLRRAVRRRILGPPPPSPQAIRRRELAARTTAVQELVGALEAGPAGRLLVVEEHAPQLVQTDDGPRTMNPYLDPIADRLRDSPLDPIVLDIRARAGNDETWRRLGAGTIPWRLPADAVAAGEPISETPPRRPPERPPDPSILAWRTALPGRIDVAGLDLGPILAAEVADAAARWLPGMRASIERIGRFLARLRPAGILLADEYHRQDWMEAARAVGIPVAAIQHGLIYPHHNGYVHRRRPAVLRLPQRTYVFGRWERDLLVERSVYRDDEVVVAGSPRLDLVRVETDGRADYRRILGARDGQRLVLISGTWGGLYRRIHYPIALAALADRPLSGVHIVVKLHPGEKDDGPYRSILESAAAAHGVDPPTVTTVQHADLYRLLAAADAHLGVHSTVLTEAVVTRTPNLLAEGVAGADLLGYVDAGVALPVRDGASLLRALDAAADGALGEEDAATFVAAHFEPGRSAERIAANLLEWLS